MDSTSDRDLRDGPEGRSGICSLKDRARATSATIKTRSHSSVVLAKSLLGLFNDDRLTVMINDYRNLRNVYAHSCNSIGHTLRNNEASTMKQISTTLSSRDGTSQTNSDILEMKSV